MFKILKAHNIRLALRETNSDNADRTKYEFSHEKFFFNKMKMSLKNIQNNFGVKLNVESDFEKLMGNDNNKKIKWGIENQ